MLECGYIKLNNNPYSLSVLLVRKKDGSRRFRVDYHALNNITIMDRFPNPTINELLDELGGVVIFSKLDLCAEDHQI